MYFHGSFLTQSDETVSVHIVTRNSRTEQVEIGDDKSGVFFTTNPIEIESSVNDTFDHLLRNQATIRLLTRDFIQDFFCTSCMDAVVNIFKGDKCIFAGFIEPQVYSQPYNGVYDELEISCIDVLSALQYSKYRNIGTFGIEYGAVRADAGIRTFGDIIASMFGACCADIDLTENGGIGYYFDGSKKMKPATPLYGIFDELAISELLFLGDGEDSVWQQDKVLEAILKYLNLHIVQDGLQFYIFSWESLKNPGGITWRELSTKETKRTAKDIVTIGMDNVSSDDTSISIGEVYNQISLTCKTEDLDSVVESPFDSEAVISPYTNRQKYMTELSSDGEGSKAHQAFYDMCHDIDTDYGGGVITDWFVQVKNHPAWTFTEAGTDGSLIDKYCKDNTDQQMLPNLMPKSPNAILVSLGKVEHKLGEKDDTPISKIDMDDYLAVSVNGQYPGVTSADGVYLKPSDDVYPSANDLRDRAPLAVYHGSTAGGTYSPADDDTTNYIVMSGKIALNPTMLFSAKYKPLHDDWDSVGVWHKTVPSRTNGDGRYYTQKYYKAATPFAKPVWDEDTARGLVPFTGTGPQGFKYSATDDGISRIPVLACMLIIGNKCLVEKWGSGGNTFFEWHTYKTPEECADIDEYHKQCFTIGFNPKPGDYLIGEEFDIQNNISHEMGIEAEGTAIPVRKRDGLTGAVKFMILGPVNATFIQDGGISFNWPVVAADRHNIWYKFNGKSHLSPVPMLAFISSIFLKSFEIKIYSDNGHVNNSNSDDIIYVSDTHEKYINRKDDIDFDICSALTREERIQLGVTETVSLSTAVDINTGVGIVSIYDVIRGQEAKPEQLYVDSYYTEYHMPRIQMVQKLRDEADIVSLFNHYKHPAMPDKSFYVQGISRNLIEGYAEITLKEVWND